MNRKVITLVHKDDKVIQYIQLLCPIDFILKKVATHSHYILIATLGNSRQLTSYGSEINHTNTTCN